MNETPDKTGLAREAHARDVVARDRRHVWHPYTQHGTSGDPLLITGARGASLFDAQGREILDLIASWWTCTHGHAHPKLNEALARQANEMEHVMFAGFTHEPAVNLATALAEILPGDLSRVFFSDDGSTAVEVALKIAYQYWANRGDTRKRVFISFDGGYHGDTLGRDVARARARDSSRSTAASCAGSRCCPSLTPSTATRRRRIARRAR